MSLCLCKRVLVNAMMSSWAPVPGITPTLLTPSTPARLRSSFNSSEVLDTVSKNIDRPDAATFAVVHVKSRQFKVCANDVIQTDNLNLDAGTEITLDKVLLVGSFNYTLVGRPLLPKTTAEVKALVIERSRGPYLRVFNSGKHTLRTFNWGSKWKKVQFVEPVTTMLRIKSISVRNEDIKSEGNS